MALTKATQVSSNISMMGTQTASSFGFTGQGNESALAAKFLDHCIDNKLEAVIDMDVNWDGFVYKRGGFKLTGTGMISGFVKITGEMYPITTNNVIVGTSGDYAFQAGANLIPGDFRAFSAGDKVLIRLDEDKTAFKGDKNQIGIHLTTVTDADIHALTIADALPWPFDVMIVGKVQYTKIEGEVTRGTYKFSGDFSHLVAGNVVRFENTKGTDSVDGQVGYFEYARVKSCSSTELVLMEALKYNYNSPVVFAGRYIDSIQIHDAKFDVLHLQCILNPQISGCFMHRSINGYFMNGTYSDVTAVGDTPTIVSFTYPRGVTISNVTASGAKGTTDNSAFKVMGPIGCTVSDITVDDYGITSGNQSINGIYIDFLFTPYRGWCDTNTITNVVAGQQKGGLGAWFDGMRFGSISNVVALGHIRLYELEDVVVDSVTTSDHLFVRNCVRMDLLHPQACGIQQVGVEDYRCLHAKTTGKAISNANRCMSVAGSTQRVISKNVSIIDYSNLSTTSTDITLHFQNVEGIFVDNISDKAVIASSITTAGNITAPVSIARHTLNGSMNIGSWSSLVDTACDVGIGARTDAAGASWDRRRLRIRDHYIFADTSYKVLRVKTGSAPTKADDGGIIGVRVGTPSSKHAAGAPNQYSMDDSYLYFWQNTNKGWQRVAWDQTWSAAASTLDEKEEYIATYQI